MPIQRSYCTVSSSWAAVIILKWVREFGWVRVTYNLVFYVRWRRLEGAAYSVVNKCCVMDVMTAITESGKQLGYDITSVTAIATMYDGMRNNNTRRLLSLLSLASSDTNKTSSNAVFAILQAAT